MIRIQLAQAYLNLDIKSGMKEIELCNKNTTEVRFSDIFHIFHSRICMIVVYLPSEYKKNISKFWRQE